MGNVHSSKGYSISTDKKDLDFEVVYNFLTQSYWAKGISREVVQRSIENSLTFGLFHGKAQIGFARLITDMATFAYLADVFILPEYRGRGLSKVLLTHIFRMPAIQRLRSVMLATSDAHGLYRKFGFVSLNHPEKYMIFRPDESNMTI